MFDEGQIGNPKEMEDINKSKRDSSLYSICQFLSEIHIKSNGIVDITDIANREKPKMKMRRKETISLYEDQRKLIERTTTLKIRIKTDISDHITVGIMMQEQ